MVGNCNNICYSPTVIHKKQSPAFDDELFQSHTAHGLCNYTFQQKRQCACVLVCVCVCLCVCSV
jgi:hypothetical protein